METCPPPICYEQAGFKPVANKEDQVNLPNEIKKCSDHLNGHYHEHYIMHCSDIEKGLSTLKK